MRALFVSLILVPAAGGCTLWYLASDPYDGVGQSATGADGGFDDARGDGCIPAGTSADCETCGHACAGNAACVKNGDTQHCGATTIDSTQPLSLAVSGNQIFLLDQLGSVWTFADDIAPDGGMSELYDSGTTSTQVPIDGLAVDNGAVYWANPSVGIEVLPLDGGAPSTARPDVHVFRIAHQRARLAWTAQDTDTNTSGVKWSTIDGGTDLLASGGFQITSDVDPHDVVLLADGNSIGWVGDNIAHVDALLSDGGNGKVGYSPVGDGGTENLSIAMASNGEDVFFTWGGKGINGSLYWLPAGATEFAYLTPMSGTGGAPVFAGNGLVYWAGTNGTISYCDPHADCSNPKTLILATAGSGPITYIVATQRYIFFSDGGHVYRIEPFPP